MQLVIIFGPQAVGKMTVGQELEKFTGLKLFHNHMTIELVSPLFNYGSKAGRKLVDLFRKKIFEEFAKSDQKGMVFTYVRAFDQKADREYINKICHIFESQGGKTYFVELEADVNERLTRNKHPHRLAHKATKRNIERSEKDLKDSMEKYRLNSKKGEIKKKEYIRINNTNLSPEETAKKIQKAFKL